MHQTGFELMIKRFTGEYCVFSGEPFYMIKTQKVHTFFKVGLRFLFYDTDKEKRNSKLK